MRKTTQKEILDKGMQPRQVIFDVINLLVSDRSKNYSEDDKRNKIILWHVSLSDLTDDEIRAGMIKVSRTKNEFIPDSGTFYESCKGFKRARPQIDTFIENP